MFVFTQALRLDSLLVGTTGLILRRDSLEEEEEEEEPEVSVGLFWPRAVGLIWPSRTTLVSNKSHFGTNSTMSIYQPKERK